MRALINFMSEVERSISIVLMDMEEPNFPTLPWKRRCLSERRPGTGKLRARSRGFHRNSRMKRRIASPHSGPWRDSFPNNLRLRSRGCEKQFGKKTELEIAQNQP